MIGGVGADVTGGSAVIEGFVVRRRALVGAALSVAVTGNATAQPAPVWFGRYWAVKWRDGKKIWLAMYRKRLGEPRPEAAPKPVVFLVHGSSIAALASYDLSVPGGGEYSLMNVLARAGFDVWTMDHEGYGESSRTAGNSNIASGVADLKAAVEMVAHETGETRYDFLGESSGAIRAGAFAAADPKRAGRLVLSAFTYTGKDSPTLAKRAQDVVNFRTHNRRKRDRAMIESIFTRDKPGTTDPAVPEAIARAELVYGDTVPTGTYLDMVANLPLVDPREVQSPVMVARGQYDGISTMADLWDFFHQLPSGDKSFTVIPNAAHSLVTARNRALFWHAALGFLTMPSAISIS
jgi:alpha-beta hydrolase superfamily lysophospholipase